MTELLPEHTKSIMDSSFLTLPPSYEETKSLSPPSLCNAPVERGRSPNFLSSMKNIVQQPLKRMRSPNRSHSSNNDSLSIDTRPQQLGRRNTSRHSHCGVHTGPCQNSSHSTHISPHRRKARRREPVPSMADYLTLAQLEVIWRSQDTYKGAVEAPRAVSPRMEETRPRSASNQETAYQANARLNAWSRPRQYRSHDDIDSACSRNPDNLYDDIMEYFGK